MTTRIDELPVTVLPTPNHEFPAMLTGQTVKLTVSQVINLTFGAIRDLTIETTLGGTHTLPVTFNDNETQASINQVAGFVYANVGLLPATAVPELDHEFQVVRQGVASKMALSQISGVVNATPFRTVTASTNLVVGDAGGVVVIDAAATNVVTIPVITNH